MYGKVAFFLFLFTCQFGATIAEPLNALRGSEEIWGSRRKLLDEDIQEILKFASIPIISAIVGYITNKVALWLTFHPANFVGRELCGKYSRIKDQPIGCCGIQGIVPTKAGKMAAQATELMMTEVFDIQEIFQKIDKKKAAEHLREGFQTAIHAIIDQIADKYLISKDTSFKTAEKMLKEQITAWALDELPAFSESFMGDLIENLDEVYDLKAMCVDEMVANPKLIVDIFENVGRKEMRFIENSGAYFGFLFGLVQLTVFYFYERGFLLPIFGFIVGYATNDIALKMIFLPVEEKRFTICGREIVIQGLFLKRQKEASISFARRIVGTVLHSENIWKHMLTGKKSEAFKLLLDKHTDAFTERMIGYSKPLVKVYLGDQEFTEMKSLTKEMSRNQIETIIEFMHEYTDEALDLEAEIGAKMGALPSAVFEQVLHPVFQEDEIKLILLGAALGTLVGLFQQFVIFG